MKKSLLKFLFVFVIVFCFLGLSTAFAVESADQAVMVENTISDDLIRSISLNSTNYQINVNGNALLALLSNQTLLDSKVQEDGCIYEYVYVKLNDGETSSGTETVTINEISYAKYPFAIAKKIDGTFYPVGLYETTSAKLTISSEESSREVSFNFLIDDSLARTYIYLYTEAGDDFSLKGTNTEILNAATYNREIGNNNCSIYVKSLANLGQSVELSPFGTLSFVETNAEGYSIYKKELTDLSLFNKDFIRSMLILPESKVLCISEIDFDGDLLEINDPKDPSDSKGTDETAKISIKDDSTNVILTADEGVITNGTTLKVTEITEGEKFESIKKVITDSKYKIFSISLLLNGTEVQPNGKVKVSIPIPTGYNKENLIVYYVDTTGATTKHNVTVSADGNYAIFETDHFSDYVLAEVTTSDASSATNKSNPDGEPKTGINNPISFVFVVLAVSCLGLTICIKKMSK